MESYADRARQRKADDAAALDINDALIDQLVETFYARIRDHAMLGPILTSTSQVGRHILRA